MDAGVAQLRQQPGVRLWVLKENGRAIRFYEKCGFRPDGEEKELPALSAREIRMVRR
jgi:ribosomal protein S18 acetylase RimI-like enzyme